MADPVAARRARIKLMLDAEQSRGKMTWAAWHEQALETEEGKLVGPNTVEAICQIVFGNRALRKRD